MAFNDATGNLYPSISSIFWKRLVSGENDMYKQLNVAIFSRHLAHCDQASNLQLFGPYVDLFIFAQY